MDWLERTNRALEYIEENLMNDINYEDIAKMACSSPYHFSRMFASITEISLSEYIRRRRLSLAAFELQNSDIRIIDLAIKYGYDSPDSFTRAFQKIHGVTPTKARNKGIILKAFPKISFQITIKGDIEMEYRIEELDFDFTVVGIKKQVITKDAFKIVPKLWSEASQNGLLQKLIDMSWEAPKCKLESLLGISGDNAAIMSDKFDYFMGVRYENELPDDMEKIVIPKSTWAVFPNVKENSENVWRRIYAEWIPTSGYELADIPCIECFYPPNHNPECEIWVPIIKP